MSPLCSNGRCTEEAVWIWHPPKTPDTRIYLCDDAAKDIDLDELEQV